MGPVKWLLKVRHDRAKLGVLEADLAVAKLRLARKSPNRAGRSGPAWSSRGCSPRGEGAVGIAFRSGGQFPVTQRLMKTCEQPCSRSRRSAHWGS
jgi:hypothetical protein